MKDLDQWLLVMRDASLAGDTAALLALRSSLASQVGASEVGMDSCGLWARFVVGTVDYPMRWVPPGTFLMGASPEAGPNYDPDATENDGPVREVTLTTGFWLGWHPVTVAQYLAFCEATRHRKPLFLRPRLDGPELPVTCVTRRDALDFAAWFHIEGLVSTLPTETQWEYAARGSDGRRYPWGNEPPDPTRARFDVGAGKEGRPNGPAPIGGRSRGRSPFGVEDMAGNVFEMCQDAWEKSHLSELTNPYCAADDPNVLRTVRGSAWYFPSSSLRCSFRYKYPPWVRQIFLGFRLALWPASPS